MPSGFSIGTGSTVLHRIGAVRPPPGEAAPRPAVGARSQHISPELSQLKPLVTDAGFGVLALTDNMSVYERLS
jgi:hypothetical protein